MCDGLSEMRILLSAVVLKRGNDPSYDRSSLGIIHALLCFCTDIAHLFWRRFYGLSVQNLFALAFKPETS